MCKLRRITHKLNIKPSGFTQFVSDSPGGVYTSIKCTKLKFIPILMFKSIQLYKLCRIKQNITILFSDHVILLLSDQSLRAFGLLPSATNICGHCYQSVPMVTNGCRAIEV